VGVYLEGGDGFEEREVFIFDELTGGKF